MNTLPFDADAVSPGIGSRQSVNCDTAMSSRAHPVTPIDPTMPCALFAGVSTAPNGSVVPA